MSHDDTPSQVADVRATGGLPPWKKGLLAMAATSVVLGLALGQVEEGDESPGRPETEETSAQALPSDVDATEHDPHRSETSLAPELDALGEPSLALDSTTTSALTEFASPGSLVPHTSSTGDGSSGSASLAAPDPSVSDPSRPITVTPGRPAAGSPSRQGPMPWSPLFLKGGLSIFVGFCIGHALRAFFKVTFIALGAVFLVAIGLQYAGLFEIDWESAGGLYDQAVARISGELDDLRTFVAGSLPSAGLGSLGLFAGFKRTA